METASGVSVMIPIIGEGSQSGKQVLGDWAVVRLLRYGGSEKSFAVLRLKILKLL